MYMNVPLYIDWIKANIVSNGGMYTCNFIFSADPTIGNNSYHKILLPTFLIFLFS